MATSASLFQELSALREAVGVSRFDASRCLELSKAGSGGDYLVSQLCRYAKLVGVDVRLVSSGPGAEVEALRISVAELSDALGESSEGYSKAKSQVRRLQKEVKGLKADFQALKNETPAKKTKKAAPKTKK